MTRSFRPLKLLAASALIAALSGGASATAQENVNRETLTLQSVTDNAEFVISYYSSPVRGEGAADSPVVIFIHGGGGNESRLVWEKRRTNTETRAPIAELMNKDGYAVVTMDMRGHGESKQPGRRGRVNYDALLGDVEAVKNFLMAEHQEKKLNINKLGLVAVGDYAPVAARYAEIDWSKPDYDDAVLPKDRTPRGRDVQAIVLFSPELASGRLKTGVSLKKLVEPSREVAVLIFSGADDPRDKGHAGDIARMIRADAAPDDNRFSQVLPTKFHGTDLFGQRGLTTEAQMLKFFELYLKQIESPWVDRRSKLSR